MYYNLHEIYIYQKEEIIMKIAPILKRRFAPIRNAVKRDIKETAVFYSNNAKRGWQAGQVYLNEKDCGAAVGLLVKTVSAAAHTRLRGKDVLPLLGCGLFTFSNPFIGMGLVGYALGKSVNKFISKFVSGVKASAAYMPPR